GRLIAVDLHNITSTYSYDASDRLVLQRIGEDKTHELYYQGETRVAEILRESGVVTRSLHAYGTPVATVTGTEKPLLGTDGHG
ncbi:hypothetical protein, partial [Xenorhabdus bovienii]|uniref:hypothetical protein n=1 Tax=Xenorhabdus bovienii TaxID=40576 RepID=UPI0023B24594